jgi:hypothetical protein
MDGKIMKNKKLYALLLLIPLSSIGGINDLKEERMKMLSDLGLPLPGSGIKLVTRSVLGLSEEQIKKGDAEKKQMEDKGFIEEQTTRPTELLYFKGHADSEFKQFKNDDRYLSTHIRRTHNELKLGFKFKPIPKSLVASTIGFVPQGAFHKEYGGWSGIVQFFEYKKNWICAYAIRNVEASQTAVQLVMEDVVYAINNKPTLMDVRGNQSSGFDYKIKWFDNENFHELECANMNYSADLTNSVIALANQIDAYQ